MSTETQTLRRLVRSLAIATPADRVFHALTSPNEVRGWWAENADIDLRPGGSFRLWGPDVYEVYQEAQAKQTISEVVPDRKLVIRWPSRDGVVQITILLEPIMGGARVNFSLQWASDRELAQYTYDDLVQVTLYNLRSYLENGYTSGRVAFRPFSETVKVGILIHASAKDTWDALTVPSTMDRWLSTNATVDLQVGGTYEYGWGDEVVDGRRLPHGATVVSALESEASLTHGWHYTGEPATEVTWTLKEEGAGTVVTLCHGPFPDAEWVDGYRQGWMAFLYRLAAVLENKDLVV